MSLRDLCDVALVMRLEQARQEAQLMTLAAVMGGVEYVDPVQALMEELAAEPVERPDRALREALGLST